MQFCSTFRNGGMSCCSNVLSWQPENFAFVRYPGSNPRIDPMKNSTGQEVEKHTYEPPSPDTSRYTTCTREHPCANNPWATHANCARISPHGAFSGLTAVNMENQQGTGNLMFAVSSFLLSETLRQGLKPCIILVDPILDVTDMKKCILRVPVV